MLDMEVESGLRVGDEFDSVIYEGDLCKADVMRQEADSRDEVMHSGMSD